MFTQCSNCRTLFRITDEQLAAVDGKVRCGFCYSTFNAYDALYEEIPDVSDEPDEDAVAEEEVLDAHFRSEPANEHTIAPEPAPPAPAPRAAPPASAPQRSVPRAEPPAAAAPAAPPRRAEPRIAPLQPKPELNPPRPAAPAPRPTAETPAARKERAPEPEVGAPPPDLFDAINLAGRELQHFKRAELDHLRHAKPAALVPASTGLGWAVGALAMIVLLAGQIMYQMRGDLARTASLRPWIQQMCEWTGCTIPLQNLPQLIKPVSQDMRTHPTNAQALQVRARFINEAPLAQFFPILELELTDITGASLGKRQFTPDQYLVNKATEISAGLAPRAQFDVELDIVDTNRKAVGYNISFR